MGKKFVIIAFILLLSVVGVVLWPTLRSRPKEPEYQGKKLRAWLVDYQKQFEEHGLYPEHPATSTPSQDAIRKIGTNAIPFLLMMAESHENRVKAILKEKIGETLHASSMPSPVELDTQMQAADGFEALGAEAKPAVPGLIQLLGNGNPDVRFSAALSLGMIGPAAKDAVPALLSHINDRYLDVQTHSVVALGEIHGDASTVVPALTNTLAVNSRFCECHIIRALGKFGAEAKAAVPAITPYLNGPNSLNREYATNAMKQIDPAAAAKAGVK